MNKRIAAAYNITNCFPFGSSVYVIKVAAIMKKILFTGGGSAGHVVRM